MVTCPNCGEENRKEAIYCRRCGEKIQSNIYIKSREPWGLFHIGILLISVIVLIISFGLIMGGTSIRSIQELMTDKEGFIMSNTRLLEVPSYGIVADEIDFNIDPIGWRFFDHRGGFIKFKITTESTNHSKEIFLGIARQEDTHDYIDSMEYHEIKEMDMRWDVLDGGTFETSYTVHQGGPPSVPPTVHSFWIVHGISAEPQTIIWEPQAGSYYLVIMNSDGSAGVSSRVNIGVQMPFFTGIGNVLIVIGIFVGLIGVAMIIYIIRTNRP
jgi:hypothetical protein